MKCDDTKSRDMKLHDVESRGLPKIVIFSKHYGRITYGK